MLKFEEPRFWIHIWPLLRRHSCQSGRTKHILIDSWTCYVNFKYWNTCYMNLICYSCLGPKNVQAWFKCHIRYEKATTLHRNCNLGSTFKIQCHIPFNALFSREPLWFFGNSLTVVYSPSLICPWSGGKYFVCISIFFLKKCARYIFLNNF